MTTLKLELLLAAASLAAACATAPEQSTQSASAAPSAQTSVAPSPSGEVVPARVIDLNAMVDDTQSTVICREMLKQGSNVIVKTCMTRADWKKFEAWQARDAQEIVRMLQGSAYRY